MDFESDNRAVTVNRANSTARLVNLAGYGQVIANGDTLTAFTVHNPLDPDVDKSLGTDYFPATGSLGKTWFIPRDLFDSNETLELDLSTRNYQGIGDEDLKFQVANSYISPTDYYIMPTSFMEDQPDVVAIPRGVTAPSKPDHFKIRVVNLSGNIKNQVVNFNGKLEDLTGGVSLAYADGTLVNAKTNNVSSLTRASEYIELPYGTYQFKMLMQDGRQMPALGSELYATSIIDPPTSTLPIGSARSSDLTYAPIQTYQPGGIYTIVVAPQQFRYLVNEMDETSNTYQNSFQIVSDNSAPVNNTYFRLQAVNAFDARNFSFRIDGKPLGELLSFGSAGAYSILIQGKHKIEALDEAGQVIATTEQELRAAQNYTAWLYPDAPGKAKLLIVANDLSGSRFNSEKAQEDGTFSRDQYKYFFQSRFLNLSVGNPYITFTQDNGQSVAGNSDNLNAGLNLQPGVPLFERPNIFKFFDEQAYQLMAYRSKPNVVPGIWAQDIEPLKSEAFIANKALYQNAGRAVPVHEPGIFTVALIGRSGTDVSPLLKAKMIIVKHNK
ncbi:DUF4397 domain-containing protein [Desertivirga xinjiangensis]|uniref:DUF4397 domain-containing protein n=1 Tax=Desertivirga xinjiangensis TaxID=539206 RepID=UPI00210ED9EB|nr:DUF4397 domain-containing protein [Pedobacter xinjiangensis]